MNVRVIGNSSKTGDPHELLKMASKGKYQLHTGATSAERKKNPPVLCDTIEEAITHIRQGLHPRMRNMTQKHGRPRKTQGPDIMAPSSLILLRQQPTGEWLQEII